MDGAPLPRNIEALLVSIVVPFFNEEDSVSAFRARLVPCLEEIQGIDWQIICIDDGSRDATLPCLIAAAAEDPRFRILEFSRNFGKEAALTAGLEAAEGDAVIPIDADLQDPPELIGAMISAWRNGAEVVLAHRSDRMTDSRTRRQTASWFYKVHNLLSGTKIPDNVGDFRLMDRCVVDALKRLPERQRFMKGLFAWVGFRTVTLDYVRAEREAGHSKFSPFALWNFAMEGVTSFSTAPLKIWTFLGACTAILTLAYAAYIFLRTIFFGINVPGYASMFVAILFFGSVQMVSVGMLGEYIGRIYIETKQRPAYLIRQIYGAAAAPVARPFVQPAKPATVPE